MPRAGESGVPSASVIFCVALWVAKQYQGRPRRQARHSPHTARQLRTTKSPGCEVAHVRSDRLDDPGRLVAEEEGEVVVDPALAVVQVGVADAARLDGDDRLARPGVGHDDRLHGDGRALRRGDHAAHFLSHVRDSSASARLHDAQSSAAAGEPPQPAAAFWRRHARASPAACAMTAVEPPGRGGYGIVRWWIGRANAHSGRAGGARVVDERHPGHRPIPRPSRCCTPAGSVTAAISAVLPGTTSLSAMAHPSTWSSDGRGPRRSPSTRVASRRP